MSDNNNKDNNEKPSFLDHAKAKSSSSQPSKPEDSAAKKPEPASDKPSIFDLSKQGSQPAFAQDEPKDDDKESLPETPEAEAPIEKIEEDSEGSGLPWLTGDSQETSPEDSTPAQEEIVEESKEEKPAFESLESIIESNQNNPDQDENEPQTQIFQEASQEDTPPSTEVTEDESAAMDMLFNKEPENSNEEEATDEPNTDSGSSFLKDIIGDSGNKDEDAVFKAYAPFDYIDEDPFKDLQEDNKPKIKLSRQAIILIIALLLAGGFFIFETFFKREVNTESRRRKAPRKERRRSLEAETELLPLWGVTQQQSKDWIADVKLIKASFSAAGRSDPFAVPQSVIDDLRKAIEAEIAADKPPDVFRRTAYRASLVGVLTSEDDTLALVNFRAAVFDIIDGTTKPKIIKLAIKAINKAKDDSLEVFEEDFIGPWKVKQIETGRESANESRMIIERDGDEKELRMGVPVDLGIFDEEGELAIFKEEDEADSKSSSLKRRR